MFENWYLEDLLSEKIRKIWKLTDYYLLKSIFDILEKTSIISLLNEYTSIEEIIKKKNYDEKVYSSIQWILDRLKLDDYLEGKIESSKTYYKRTQKEMTYDLDEIIKTAESEAPNSISAFNMLKLISENYPAYLKGEKKGVDIVFSPEKIEIIYDYYRNNLFYNVHNIAGAKVLNWDIKSRREPKVIEIGGGLGGGIKQFILQRLKNNEKLTNFKYYFTDIANKMLRMSRKSLLKITDNLEAFEFTKLNFNKSFSEQWVENNSIDVIWGVNAAHVATDLRFTLSEIFKSLKKGGAIILTETVRAPGNQMIQQELLLNTLDDYWNVKIDTEIRPRHGFMEWKDWENALKAIGFINVETIPDMNLLEKEYDNCYITVVRGIKP